MINLALYVELSALHNENKSLPHPLENLPEPVIRPISPKKINVTQLPSAEPAHQTATNDSLQAVVEQHLSPIPVLHAAEASEGHFNQSIQSDSTIVKKLEQVEIKQPIGHSSTESDGSKRKEENCNKEVSSPVTKKPRKKRN